MYLADVFTVFANLVGGPALSMPAGFGVDGLPIGVQLAAAEWREDRLFAAARALPRSPITTGGGLPVRPRHRRGAPPAPGGAGYPARLGGVIGLEVHAQLRTRSKIFCGCANRFGAPPNSSSARSASATPGCCRC